MSNTGPAPQWSCTTTSLVAVGVGWMLSHLFFSPSLDMEGVDAVITVAIGVALLKSVTFDTARWARARQHQAAAEVARVRQIHQRAYGPPAPGPQAQTSEYSTRYWCSGCDQLRTTCDFTGDGKFWCVSCRRAAGYVQLADPPHLTPASTATV